MGPRQGGGLLFHVYNNVVRSAGQELFRRYVVGVFLDVPHVGRHEQKVAWSGLHPFLEVLAIVDSDVAGNDIRGGLGLTVHVGRTLVIGL